MRITRFAAIVERAEDAAFVDRWSGALDRLGSRLVARDDVADLLRGAWLGHPVHPPLTDLPIGFWTSGSLLDLLGDRHGRLADSFVGLGLASAVPTAAAGLADLRSIDGRPQRRVGTVHAAANTVAIVLYALSLVARIRRRRSLGRALGFAGATAATVGGTLGGHLTFGLGAGVNPAGHTAPAGPDVERRT